MKSSDETELDGEGFCSFFSHNDISTRLLSKFTVNLTGINPEILILSVLVVTIAIVTKLAGCGLPSLLFLRDKSKAMIVGIGMISRGEVGLIVAGIGVTSGVLSPNIYTTVIIMIGVTTLITPVWLKSVYSKEQIVSDDAEKSR